MIVHLIPYMDQASDRGASAGGGTYGAPLIPKCHKLEMRYCAAAEPVARLFSFAIGTCHTML